MTKNGYDRLDDRGEKIAGHVADHPIRTVFEIIACFFVLAVIVGLIGWLGGWFNEAKRITGTKNTSDQYAAVIQDWQDMLNSSANACQAQTRAKQDGDPVLVEDPALAYAGTYRRVRADFNRRQQNFFEAKIVGPSGYPRTVTSFPTELTATPDWCMVSERLQQIHD